VSRQSRDAEQSDLNEVDVVGVAVVKDAATLNLRPIRPGVVQKEQSSLLHVRRSSLTIRRLGRSSMSAPVFLELSERVSRTFVLRGSLLAGPLSATEEECCQPQSSKQQIRLPGSSTPTRFPRSNRPRVTPEAKRIAMRSLGVRSCRFITDKLGGPVDVLVNVIDDIGFRTLTEFADTGSIKTFRERTIQVHAMLHRLPVWIADPIKGILGRWSRTLRQAKLAVFLASDGDEEIAQIIDQHMG
jgi:hypothetical protein